MRSPPRPYPASAADPARDAGAAAVEEFPQASGGRRTEVSAAQNRADGVGPAETFELHFREAEVANRIEVVICLRHDLIHRIRALPDPPYDEVEVRRSGELLFTLLR